MMNHAEKAEALFREGYNCAQATLMAFNDLTGLDEQTALKLSSPFGGGVGRLREMCGALSGVLMAMGALYGYDDPKAKDEKLALYEDVRKLCGSFQACEGSYLCRELLGETAGEKGAPPAERNAKYYGERPCPKLCYQAAALLDQFVQSHPIP